jgi:hypothetical protein
MEQSQTKPKQSRQRVKKRLVSITIGMTIYRATASHIYPHTVKHINYDTGDVTIDNDLVYSYKYLSLSIDEAIKAQNRHILNAAKNKMPTKPRVYKRGVRHNELHAAYYDVRVPENVLREDVERLINKTLILGTSTCYRVSTLNYRTPQTHVIRVYIVCDKATIEATKNRCKDNAVFFTHFLSNIAMQVG